MSSLSFVVGAEGLTVTFENGNAALHLATSKHDLDMVEGILKNNLQKWVDKSGATKSIALHLALECFQCSVRITVRCIHQATCNVGLRTNK